MSARPPGRQSPRLSVRAGEQAPALAGLDLDALRAYRERLGAEEDRVSYWRRVVHGRIDVIGAGAGRAGSLSHDDLVRALGDTGTGLSRRALVGILPAEPWPDLPVLAELWAVQTPVEDHVGRAGSLDRLREAEGQLTAYRRVLHDRIDESTRELILRYRADPASAVLLLPEG